MATRPSTATNWQAPVLDAAAVAAFRAQLRGPLISPQDADYEEARRAYNAMIDRYPLLIARAVDVADVIAAVNFARDQGLPLAIRGGGHNVAGLGSVDDGLLLDLSSMKGIHVDPVTRTARVAGGCTWGEVDHATHAFGLAVPSGIISTTGVAGLTLGGGSGHLTRKYGLTIDNLLSVDMVLADGRAITASDDVNADLFWAIRGGGGNFGVVTSFLFQAHPVDTVIAGPTLWPLEQAADAMRFYRDFMAGAPEDLNGAFAFLIVPPAPPFPEALQLKTMCGVIWCYTGPAEQAEAVFAPVRAFGPPALDGVHALPYPALQGAFDALYPPGLQHYWKADFVRELPDEAIAQHVAHGATVPTIQSTMHLYPIDGAAHRRGEDDTAYSYRDARWSQVIVGASPKPEDAQMVKDWAVDYWNATHPYSAGGAYVNFMMEEGQDRIRATYRDNYERLVAIKRAYDPTNLFHVNQNINPNR
ncbi:MAG TPA: FAD-binding oxidoreductase [Thermomicrobiaceae bacterium]|nr:FAD-binding oxidoreductase [Thermomicrobiaceae bacterium]